MPAKTGEVQDARTGTLRRIKFYNSELPLDSPEHIKKFHKERSGKEFGFTTKNEKYHLPYPIKIKLDDSDSGKEIKNENYIDGILKDEDDKYHYFYAEVNPIKISDTMLELKKVLEEAEDQDSEKISQLKKILENISELEITVGSVLEDGSILNLQQGYTVEFEPEPAGICEVELYDSEPEGICEDGNEKLKKYLPKDSEQRKEKNGKTLIVEFVYLTKITGINSKEPKEQRV